MLPEPKTTDLLIGTYAATPATVPLDPSTDFETAAANKRAEAQLERKHRDERLSGVLEERRRAEEELAEAAGRHEEATAAFYRLRSAIERLDLRREQGEQTAGSLRAESARPKLAFKVDPTYEGALVSARVWPATQVSPSLWSVPPASFGSGWL